MRKFMIQRMLDYLNSPRLNPNYRAKAIFPMTLSSSKVVKAVRCFGMATGMSEQEIRFTPFENLPFDKLSDEDFVRFYEHIFEALLDN